MAEEAGAKALFDKFGTYVLPGRVEDPRRAINEAQEAERIGLGAVWISERFALKEPAVLAGAGGQKSRWLQDHRSGVRPNRQPRRPRVTTLAGANQPCALPTRKLGHPQSDTGVTRTRKHERRSV